MSQIVDHRHCEVCGVVVGPKKEVCSPECEEKQREAQRIKKRTVYLFVALIAAVMMFTVLLR